MTYLQASLVGLVFQALLIYVVLRLVHGRPGPHVEPMRQARRHAFWVALIALAAGPVLGGPPSSLLRSGRTTPGGPPSSLLRSGRTTPGVPSEDWTGFTADVLADALPFFALGALTVIVIIASRPPVGATRGDLDAAESAILIDDAPSAAARVVRSGRILGYAAWCVCMVPILLTVGSPLTGLVGLAVLVLGYVCFIVAQLFAEHALARNHSAGPKLGIGRLRALPPSLLIAAVPSLVTTVGVLCLGLRIGSLPDNSPEMVFWFAAFALAVGSGTALVIVGVTRPSLGSVPDDEDSRLRRVTVRRAILFSHSSVLALAAFLLPDNRGALIPASGVGIGMGNDAYPAEQGLLGGVVISLMLAAVVVAIMPGSLPRAGRTSGIPLGTVR